MNAPINPIGTENPPPSAASGPQSIVAPEMAAVDQVIRQRLSSDVVLIGQIAEYIIQSGGKRVRPSILLMVSGALSAHLQKTSGLSRLTAEHSAIMAAVVEFIHTATLLHDDVVDESGLRRGRPTANVLFGNAASVLVGDFLYSRAFQMMVEVGSSEVMAVMAESTNVISEGEVLQLMNCQDPDVTEERYLQVIRFKTAKLFEAAAKVPAVLAQADPMLIEACAAYGRHLGTAFQLIDDALDYTGTEADIGKRLGDDLREGKPTLPLIRVMAVGTPSEQQRIRDAITRPEDADFDAVLAAIERTDAMRYTLSCAQHECQLARDALAPLQPSPYRQALTDLLDFVIERNR